MNLERRGRNLPKIMTDLVQSMEERTDLFSGGVRNRDLISCLEMELLPSLPFLPRESQIATDILQVASRKTSLTLFDFFEIPCSYRFS